MAAALLVSSFLSLWFLVTTLEAVMDDGDEE